MNTEEISENELCNVEEEIKSQESDIRVIMDESIGKRQRIDDIVAAQTVICILAATAFFVANLFYPELCEELFSLLKGYINDEKEIVPNIFSNIKI